MTAPIADKDAGPVEGCPRCFIENKACARHCDPATCPDPAHVTGAPLVTALDSLSDDIRAISRTISGSYPPDLDPEAHLWRRCMKVTEEAGEVFEALAGTVGENPRKGHTHTRDDLRTELLDVAGAALGAVSFLDDHGDPLGPLADRLAFVRRRLVDAGANLAAQRYLLGERFGWADLMEAVRHTVRLTGRRMRVERDGDTWLVQPAPDRVIRRDGDGSALDRLLDHFGVHGDFHVKPDDEFRRRLARRVEQDQRILHRLGGPDA